MKIRRFDLDYRGLARVLGELEAKILETIWDLGEATVKDVAAALGPEAHVKTVMTVMNRLVEKGLLAKEGGPGPYRYRPCYSREAFLTELARGVASGLVRDFGDYAVSQFLAALVDEKPSALAELERLLREAREEAERAVAELTSARESARARLQELRGRVAALSREMDRALSTAREDRVVVVEERAEEVPRAAPPEP